MYADVIPTRGTAKCRLSEGFCALADITSTSVELVEGALGESADFRIATYGMGSRDGNSSKPSPFNTSSDSLSDRDDDVLALQKSLQVQLLSLPAMG